MGEAAPQSDPHEEQRAPELSLCQSQPEQLYLPTDMLSQPESSDEKVWPDVLIHLSEQNLFGSQLPTNPDARLRTVVEAVRRVAREALPEIEEKTYLEHRNEQRRFLASKVKFKGESVARVLVVSKNIVFDEIWEHLKAVNHPVAQTANEVIRQNQQRQFTNKSLPAAQQQPVLSDWMIEELFDDLLLATQSEAVRAGFKDRLNKLRKEKP